MTRFFTHCFALLLFFALGTNQGFGQTPFYTQDFSGGGIPAGWTNVDTLSPAALQVIFQHTTNPNAVGPAALGYQPSSVFNAPTAANGYVWANSDRGLTQAPPSDHVTRLTTAPIDCSDKSVVYLRFQSLIGVFDYPASTNVKVRVSNNNGASWTEFTPYPCLVTGAANPPCSRWSANPQQVGINISSAAANRANVLIQWQWFGGWEYFWAIDDVELIDEDLSIQNDMRVNTFFAGAPNASTPSSQVDAFGFIADIRNSGAADQSGATLTVSIENLDEEVVFSSVLNYGAIASDSTAENVFFPDEFTPPAIPGEAYFGTYTLTIDGGVEDEVPENNTQEFVFTVSDSTFSKELGVGLGAWINVDNFSWGNIYYVPNGSGFYANTISFAIANAQNLGGRSVTTLLYKWDGDLNNNGSVDPAEYGNQPISFNIYEMTGMETGANALITIPVNIDGEQIALEDDSYYIATIQYTRDDGPRMNPLGTDIFDYTATWFYSDSLGRPRYASAFDSGNDGTYSLLFFVVPVIRLNIGTVMSSAPETQLPGDAVTVFPNPADAHFVLSLNLDSPSGQVEVSIMDASGKVLDVQRRQNLQRDQITIPTANLPSGTYAVRVRTDKGVSTKRLVVKH